MIPSGHVPSAIMERTPSSVSPVSSHNLLMRTHLFISSFSASYATAPMSSPSAISPAPIEQGRPVSCSDHRARLCNVCTWMRGTRAWSRIRDRRFSYPESNSYRFSQTTRSTRSFATCDRTYCAVEPTASQIPERPNLQAQAIGGTRAKTTSREFAALLRHSTLFTCISHIPCSLQSE